MHPEVTRGTICSQLYVHVVVSLGERERVREQKVSIRAHFKHILKFSEPPNYALLMQIDLLLSAIKASFVRCSFFVVGWV